MVKLTFSSNRQNISHFRARLIAKMVVIFISVMNIAQRLVRLFTGTERISKSAMTSFISVPFLCVISLVVLIEYICYRKLGVKILKYSKYVDIIFVLLFTGEWMNTLNVTFSTVQGDDPKYFILTSALGFTSFGYRTLLPIIIIQQWYFQIIPSIAASTYVLIFLVLNQTGDTLSILFRGIIQALYAILIYYFNHRVNFTLLIANVQKERWLQLNDFILNNIPESIAIMDSTGNASFINKHFQRLMEHHNQSQDIKKFLENIRQIHHIQQDRESEPNSEEVQTITTLETKTDLLGNTKYGIQANSSLENIIITFGKLITQGSLIDQSFQIFTGKFQPDTGEERSFEIKISFINQEPKKYILLILRDTTQRDLLLSLEGNIKYKDQLLASVSHDLRTPLNGNINLVEAALKSKDIPEKIKDTFLIPALRSSQFLLHLINDILDMSQMKAQKLRLIFQHASLRETFHSAIQLLELHAKKKGIILEANIDPHLPDMFCTDHMRLSQIVMNLINNSIKFTQKGSVRLSASYLRDSTHVNISVEDTGIGMTEEDTNQLFQDFTHIDFKNREKISPTGVGLGLKIANDLAKLLGPDTSTNKGISVTSEFGMGSTFSFLIESKEAGLNLQDTRTEYKEELSPLVANEFHTAIDINLESKMARNLSTKSLYSLGRIEIPSIASISCSCPRVLVVDDDPFNILAYEAILNSLGVKYDCAYSGRSAIDKILNKVRYPCSPGCTSYRIMFMDEEMPEMTGTETVAEIVSLQRQKLIPSVPIIGCTAHHDGESIENFMKSGISEYVPKPVSSALIQKILEKYNV